MSSFWSYFLVLGSAFVGGLILNVMPCVLPVISLKLAQITRPVIGLSPRIQLGWLIAGIFASFILFALIIYGLQRSGAAVGWGFHFQQPVFVLFMMAVLLCFALVQAGFLNFKSISAAQGLAARWLDHFQPSRRAFHFFYGGLITLLATPCTAPFLSGAVSFALTQSLAMIMAVFMAIASGLAVPWLILWAAPQRKQWLPAPGGWMIYVRYFAALLLYGSALWLLWVLSQQLGGEIALALFVMIHVGLLLASTVKLWPVRHAAFVLIAAMIAAPLALPESSLVSPVAITKDGLNWHIFNEKILFQKVKAGKIVFVNVSADWCLTCQYNQANVLGDKEVIARLGEEDVYLMFGDLTNVNEEVMRFIRKHGRIGIPFNGIYTAGRKKILSEILDKTDLLESLALLQSAGQPSG